jgi:hypothetical protein
MEKSCGLKNPPLRTCHYGDERFVGIGWLGDDVGVQIGGWNWWIGPRTNLRSGGIQKER